MGDEPVRLFARKAGCATSIDAHMRALAHRVLDRARSGDAEADPHINWALEVTGDASLVCPERKPVRRSLGGQSARRAAPPPPNFDHIVKPQGSWERTPVNGLTSVFDLASA